MFLTLLGYKLWPSLLEAFGQLVAEVLYWLVNKDLCLWFHNFFYSLVAPLIWCGN
jgi:hypothetical protein